MPTILERIHHAHDAATVQRLLSEYKHTGGDLREARLPAFYEYEFADEDEMEATIAKSMSLLPGNNSITTVIRA